MSLSELSRILQDARNSLDCLSRFAKLPPPTPLGPLNQCLISPLNLWPADRYLSTVHRQDVPSSVLDSCRRSLQELALRTQAAYEKTIRQCEYSANTPPPEQIIGGIRRVFEDEYHKQCLLRLQIMNQCLMKKLANEKHSTVNKGSKATFNHEYTPLLEKYFVYNAYPSGSDKALLAKRTGMTQRQIDVWFQNHRNRAKKDGRPLRRPLDGAQFTIALNGNKAVPSQCFSFPSEAETEESDSDVSSFTSRPTNVRAQNATTVLKERRCTILDTSANHIPSHVFPAPYRPRGEQNPVKISPVTWERNPSSHRGIHEPIDMEELISSFSLKLTIGEGDSNVPRRRNADQIRNRKVSWFESRITIPPTAPLPALHRSRKRAQNSKRCYPRDLSTCLSSPMELGPGPIRSCRRPGSGFANQRRKSSSASTFSTSSVGTSEDSSSGSELPTPPTLSLPLPRTYTDKSVPFHG